MSGVTGFLLAAAALLVIVLFILLRPLLRRHTGTTAVNERQEANLAILRGELRELEHARDEGSLSASDFAQAQRELQRRLLEEADAVEHTPPARATSGRRTAIALLIALPLCAASGYALLGNPLALDPANTQAPMSAQEVDALLQRLVERLKTNPDDTQGWVMLARSYKALGRFAESAEAFGRAESQLDNEPSLLADYAEVLAETKGGSFAGKPDELIARALKLSPNEPQALFLAGASANERRDFAAVADYWGRLLPQLDPGSEEARSLEAAIGKAREMVAGQKEKPAARPPTGKSISGEVILSGKLAAQARPEEAVFIFARPVGGSRMPLTVLRVRVADLPFRFILDDSTAMPGGQKLSDAKAGMATPSSGDLFGVLDGARVGRQDVRLVIDQVQP